MLEALKAIQADTLAQIDKRFEEQNQQIDKRFEKQNLQIDKRLEEQNLQIDEKLEKQSKRLLDQFNIVLEDKVSHEIRMIAEGHMNILERLPEVNTVEDLKSRIRVLERIVKEHSKTIDELRKAQ